jgi:hypothetical protein
MVTGKLSGNISDSNTFQNMDHHTVPLQRLQTPKPDLMNSRFKLHSFLLQMKQFTYGDTTTTGPYSVRWRHRSTIFINSTSELVEVGTL